VTEAYNRACAVTEEHSLPALEAAHIRPFAKDGPHEVRNGLLLRADLHRLFEQGYLTVTPKYTLEVSDRLRADYHNGRSYYPLRGTRISLPAVETERPTRELINWHNQNVFLQ
jgi:putative restriction endonuclease